MPTITLHYEYATGYTYVSDPDGKQTSTIVNWPRHLTEKRRQSFSMEVSENILARIQARTVTAGMWLLLLNQAFPAPEEEEE